MDYPEVRFIDSFLLIGTIYDDIAPSYRPPVASKDETGLLDRWRIATISDTYRNAWQPQATVRLKGMCDATGLAFRKHFIDIYCAPFRRALSFPLIIPTKYEPDYAIDVITHEIIHDLLYDNTTFAFDMRAAELRWGRLFPDVRNPIALLHIPVHAVLQYIYDDILDQPERTVRDKALLEDNPEYSQAWHYVDQHGYLAICEKIRAQTEEFKKDNDDR